MPITMSKRAYVSGKFALEVDGIRAGWVNSCEGGNAVAEVISEKMGTDHIVHKHIGDYTLFWSGVYPENLKALKAAPRRDHLVDYLRQGKRSYAIASDLSTDKADPPAAVLRRLSDNFEFCVYGLGLVRKSWERLAPQSFPANKKLLD